MSRNRPLDGLRGFAALAVVSSHLTGSVGVLPYASGGFIGVLVFFALSGYLIGGITGRLPATRAAYRSFVRRRVQRLAPVIIALVFVGGPLMVWWGRQGLRSAAFEAALALTQTTGFAVAVGAGGSPAWGPTWSLTVEWVFYLLFPLALFALRLRGLKPAMVCRVLCGTALGLYAAGLLLSPRAFYLAPVANVGVMVAGAALALSHASRTTPRTRPDPARAGASLVLLMLLTALPMASLSPAYRFIVFPAVTAATLVLISSCGFASPVTTILATRPLVGVGRSAYSLYIWHMPVMWLTFVSMPQLPRPLIGLVAVLVLVPVVTLSYLVLERPVLGGQPPWWRRGRAVNRRLDPVAGHSAPDGMGPTARATAQVLPS